MAFKIKSPAPLSFQSLLSARLAAVQLCFNRIMALKEKKRKTAEAAPGTFKSVRQRVHLKLHDDLHSLTAATALDERN